MVLVEISYRTLAWFYTNTVGLVISAHIIRYRNVT